MIALFSYEDSTKPCLATSRRLGCTLLSKAGAEALRFILLKDIISARRVFA